MRAAWLPFLLFAVAPAAAQAPSPAQIGIDASTPQNLKVLDQSKTWVQWGQVDQNAHAFTPVGPGGGPYNSSIITYATHAALLAQSAHTPALTLDQQGYYAPGEGGWAKYDWSAASTALADGVLVVLPPGQSAGTPGRYIIRVPAEGIHPEAAGAYCNTPIGGTVTNDDTTAIQNLANYLSASNTSSGTIVFNTKPNQGTCVINSATVTVPPGVKLKGVGVGAYRQTTPTIWWMSPTIQLNPSYTLLFANGQSAIENLMIWRTGLATHVTTMEQAYTYQFNTLCDNAGWNASTGQCAAPTSIAIKVTGADVIVRDVWVVGFNKGIYDNGGARIYADHVLTDTASGIEATQLFDVSLFHWIRSQEPYNGSLGSRASLYAATVPSGGGGSGYVVGDLLTVPPSSGTCNTNPILRVASVSGGAVTGYEVDNLNGSDTGDCPMSNVAETFGVNPAALPIVFGAGSGGVNGTNVQLQINQCVVKPVLLGTISGGALTAITGVQTPGQCMGNAMPSLFQSLSCAPANPSCGLSGASITGAMLPDSFGVNTPQNYYTKNAVSPTGGTGTGAQAIVSVVGPQYRPGIGLYIHDRCDGCLVTDVEYEGNQTDVKVSNVGFMKFVHIGGENFAGDWNILGVGLDLENCMGSAAFFENQFEGNGISYLLNNNSTCSSGAGQGGVNLVDLGASSGSGYPGGGGAYGIVTGPGSWGNITGLHVSGGQVGWPARIEIGASSGQWLITDLVSEGSPGLSNAIAYTMRVAPSATPPVSPQMGWKGLGSLVVNGDFTLDQPYEGLTAPDGSVLRMDRWRMSENISGESLTSQRLSGGPANGNNGSQSRYYIRVTSNAAGTVGAAQSAYLYQNIEGGQWTASAMFGQYSANQLELDFCAWALTAGNYDLFLMNTAKTLSYVHRMALTTGWACYATDINQPPTSFLYSDAGTVALTLGFDFGAGTNYQTTTADQWLSGEYHEIAGDKQLAVTNGAYISITAVHLYPVPFQPYLYQPRTADDEFIKARRFFQKSYSPGVKVGQAGATATPGAGTMLNPVVSAPTQIDVNFPPMIVPPTVTLYSTQNGTIGACTDTNNSNADVAGATAVNVGLGGFALQCPGVAAAGRQLQAAWSADTGL